MNLSANTEFYMNIWTIVAVLFFFAWIISKHITLRDKVKQLEKDTTRIKAKLDVVCEKQQSSEVMLAKVMTQLTNIQLTLGEIKTQIRNK